MRGQKNEETNAMRILQKLVSKVDGHWKVARLEGDDSEFAILQRGSKMVTVRLGDLGVTGLSLLEAAASGNNWVREKLKHRIRRAVATNSP